MARLGQWHEADHSCCHLTFIKRIERKVGRSDSDRGAQSIPVSGRRPFARTIEGFIMPLLFRVKAAGIIGNSKVT